MKPKGRIIKDNGDFGKDQLDGENLVLTSIDKKLAIKFGSLDRVDCNMTLVLLQFFEAHPKQPNIMEKDTVEVG